MVGFLTYCLSSHFCDKTTMVIQVLTSMYVVMPYSKFYVNALTLNRYILFKIIKLRIL